MRLKIRTENSMEDKKKLWKNEICYFKRVYTVQATCEGNNPRITLTLPIISIKAAIGPTTKPAEFEANFQESIIGIHFRF